MLAGGSMKTFAFAFVCTALSGLAAPSAHAGEKLNGDVNIYKNADGSGQAWGNLADARNSSDSVQMMFCSLTSTTGAPQVWCYAVNKASVVGMCVSSNWNHISVLYSMTGDAIVQFHWDSAGNCNYLAVEHSSYTSPKLP
jgi:hypothetical protein